MKIDWKKAIGLTAAVAMLVPLAACGGSSDGDGKSGASGTEDITLSVWAPQEDQAKDTNWLGQVEENFAKDHPEYNITWKNDVVSEGDASKQVSTDPSAAADVYMFASDQLGVPMDAKAIGQLGTDAEKTTVEIVFSECRAISIDYGIMEKADNVYVRCGDFGWSDVGTWGSVYQLSRKDGYANAKSHDGCYTYDTRNSIVSLPADKIAVIKGLKDYIVVDTDDVLMICPRSDEQSIKKYIDDIKFDKGDKYI